jgi:hypothetical protein
MSIEHVFPARPGIRLPYPYVHPLIVLIGSAIAIDYAKQFYKKVKKGECPTCGRAYKSGYKVKDKGCGHSSGSSE